MSQHLIMKALVEKWLIAFYTMKGLPGLKTLKPSFEITYKLGDKTLNIEIWQTKDCSYLPQHLKSIAMWEEEFSVCYLPLRNQEHENLLITDLTAKGAIIKTN